MPRASLQCTITSKLYIYIKAISDLKAEHFKNNHCKDDSYPHGRAVAVGPLAVELLPGWLERVFRVSLQLLEDGRNAGTVASPRFSVVFLPKSFGQVHWHQLLALDEGESNLPGL